jgi:hypothetical protein
MGLKVGEEDMLQRYSNGLFEDWTAWQDSDEPGVFEKFKSATQIPQGGPCLMQSI